MSASSETKPAILKGLVVVHAPLNMRREGMGLDMLGNQTFSGVINRVEAVLQKRGESAGLSLDPLRQISQYSFSLGMRKAVEEELKGRPEVESGLSVGETAAKTSRGVLKLELGAELLLDRDLATTRAKMLQREGVMIATVGAEPEKVEQSLIGTNNPDLAALVLANIVTPTMAVLSGVVNDPVKVIEALKEKFADTRNFFATQLPIPDAYHSHWMGEAQRIFQELSSRYFQVESLSLPDGKLYSPMLNKWITETSQAFQVQREQLTIGLNLRDGIPEMVRSMEDCLAFLTFDPSDKMPGIIKANLRPLKLNSAVINIYNQETFEKGIAQLRKLGIGG